MPRYPGASAGSSSLAALFDSLDTRRVVSIIIAVMAMVWAYRKLFGAPSRTPNAAVRHFFTIF